MLTLTLLFAAPVLANGQTTHIWITRHALEHLPSGDLRTLLTDPNREPMLIHGAMFPDGGYAVDHPYGEAAHWEPFQRRYLEWIRDGGGGPLTGAGGDHAAFLMGLSSHGMADQVFDAHYQDRSARFDAELGWASGDSMDEATDVGWAAATGPQDVPERWVPDTPLIAIYLDQGIDVDSDTLNQGQALLETAVGLVGLLSSNPTAVDGYVEKFPWAMTHLDDPRVPGIPSCEGEVIARYWEEIWAQLHDEPSPRDVLRTWPAHNEGGLATDPDDPNARISLVFARSRLGVDVTVDAFSVTDASTGDALPFSPWLFYGDNAHVVHLVPTAPWPALSEIDVTVHAGLPAADGSAFAERFSFQVSTHPLPADTAAPDTGPQAAADSGTDPHPPAADGCTCTYSGSGGNGVGGWLGLLGLGGLLFCRRRRVVGR